MNTYPTPKGVVEPEPVGMPVTPVGPRPRVRIGTLIGGTGRVGVIPNDADRLIETQALLRKQGL